MNKIKILFVIITGLYEFVLCQGKVYMSISTQTKMENTIDFVVTDRFGRKKGFDPRAGGIYYDSLPNTFYGYDDAGGNSIIEFLNTIYTPQDDGIWTIQIIGDTLGKFNFYVSADSYEGAQDFKYSKKLFIDKDAEMTYKFTYNGTSGAATKVEKVITITSLGQDITTGEKLNLVGSQTFVNSLQSLCSQMVTFFNAGNKVQAYNKLSSLKYQIQNAYTNPTGSQFVNEYAYTVLMEDITLTFALINCTTCESTERIQK